MVSVVDAVIADLRARMFSGELAAGTPLTEAEVAATYDVARTTAKAAIESLVSERLLERSAHKTARVITLTADDVRDIYCTRLLLEAQVLRTLAEQSRVPEAARAAHGELVARSAEGPTAIVDPDMRFHRALVDALGSPRTSRAYAVLTSEVTMCMSRVQEASLLPTELIVDEHAEILRMLETGDADGAVRVLREHLERASDRLSRSLTALPGS